MLRKKHVVIALIVCLYLSSVTIAEIDKEIRRVYVSDQPNIMTDKMVFGTCSHSRKEHSESFCTLVLETEKSIDSEDHLKVCNITLKPERKISGEIEGIIGFNEDKAILDWKYEDFSKGFAVVHFSNCKHHVVKSDIVIPPFSYAVPDGNTFSIVVHNDKWLRKSPVCKDAKLCKMTSDSKGHVLTSLVPWEFDYFDHFNIIDLVYSPSRGHLIIRTTQDATELGFISKGRFQLLNTIEGNDRLIVSKIYNLVTLCYKTFKKDFNCKQFYLDGSLKFEVPMKIQVTDQMPLAVFNIPHGGFFVVDNSCSIDDIHHCQNDHQSCLEVRKVDANGKQVGCRKLVCQMQYDHHMRLKNMKFHVNENGKYCLSYPVHHKTHVEKTGTYVDLNIVCFDDQDLFDFCRVN